MSDLTEFLLARIAEDEYEAHQALGLLGIESEWHTVGALRGRGLTRADAEHVHRWSSRRVLAECGAKRRIVATITEHERIGYDYAGPILELLALPYADHPDYREEWRA
ncbi:DUF6221 family protein [Cellulomonas denverensis]|uniref:Uncharacterized protein n=1 Tax=Cellulomonas denverensis TaxID=264297 RepID=A0A7X6QYK2_9CELL|nr:DUF6221 family protein [Cellulomonas denverensis]NKY22208.1 hypothetical protein [Cellulomonas denverensis]GIG27172.1 hypothetical protein Cde04nite_34160 [Cellulomonas denverensis]